MGFITVATELAVEKQDKHPGWIHLGCQMDNCNYKTHLLLELETVRVSAQLECIHERRFLIWHHIPFFYLVTDVTCLLASSLDTSYATMNTRLEYYNCIILRCYPEIACNIDIGV
jgi:hypothetical protein